MTVPRSTTYVGTGVMVGVVVAVGVAVLVGSGVRVEVAVPVGLGSRVDVRAAVSGKASVVGVGAVCTGLHADRSSSTSRLFIRKITL